jgi:hypothetical protein
MRTLSRLLFVVAIWATVVSCTSVNRLSEYDFNGKSLFVAPPTLASPDVHMNADAETADSTSFLGGLLELGSAIASEASAQEARSKLEKAYSDFDEQALIVEPIAGRASRYLGTDLAETENDADYVIYLDIRRQGVAIQKGVLQSSLVMVMDGQIRMVDNLDGREIWKRNVKERRTLTSGISGILGDMQVLSALSDMSEDELADGLESISRQLTQAVARELSDDMN